MDKDWVISLNRKARLPHLAILVKVSVEEAARRRQARGGPEELFDAIESQRKIADAYDLAFEQQSLGPTAIVDGETDMETVTLSILNTIREHLPS